MPLLEVPACARGCLGNRVLDWLGKETIDQILTPFPAKWINLVW
jgi:hypothetical protein